MDIEQKPSKPPYRSIGTIITFDTLQDAINWINARITALASSDYGLYAGYSQIFSCYFTAKLEPGLGSSLVIKIVYGDRQDKEYYLTTHNINDFNILSRRTADGTASF